MRRKDWWTQRLLEKLESPHNDWLDASSKYAGRIYIAAMVIFMSLMFFFIHGHKTIGLIGVTVSIAVIIYNVVVYWSSCKSHAREIGSSLFWNARGNI